MNRYKWLGLMIALLFLFASPLLGAGFLKYDGVDGEAVDRNGTTSTPQTLDSGDSTQPAGLLLPAVQSARPSAHPSDLDTAERSATEKKKGNIEYNWKVEKGEK